jgi:hypothetical protein
MTPSIHLLNNPIISAFASVLKCKLKPTTAADVSAFTSNLSVFTANTVKIHCAIRGCFRNLRAFDLH